MLLQPVAVDAGSMLLADRYVQTSGCWFDTATGAMVQVVVRRSGRRREQIEWADRCSMLARLRHPLLNPLIDYGAASSSSLFEVYAAAGTLVAPRAAASQLVTHATRFLSAHGVTVGSESAACLLRAINPVPGPARATPVGVVLQARRAGDVVAEAIGAPRSAGMLGIDLSGGAGMGLRTAWIEAARRARIDGYVVLCPAALRRWPQLEAHVERRHVCLLIWESAPPADRHSAAQFLARLAQRTARPHLCIVARRANAAGEGIIHLEALGRTAMTSMVYVDAEYGPSETEILDAVRRSEGSPGRLVQSLAGVPGSLADVTIHETPAPYGPDPERVEVRGGGAAGERRSRIDSVLWRAGSRAAALNARGRHAAARRLLGRAARALEGRGDAGQAARYWIQLGWLLRGRGATADAHECGARAGDLAIDEDRFQAALLRAACWIDEEKFADAEASLRTLTVGASTVQRTALTHTCRIELARVMLHDGRPEQASETLGDLHTAADPLVSCAAALVRSAILLAARDIAEAMRAARFALVRATAAGDQRSIARAHRAIAAASCAAGDVDQVRAHVRQGIAAASAARLPLAVLRFRGTLLRALDAANPAGLETLRLRATLIRALRRPLPASIRNDLRTAIEPRSAASLAAGPVSLLERFIQLAQKAADDDVSAVVSVVGAMLERIEGAACVVVARDGRTLVAAGRPWRESSPAVAQVLASGQGVPPDLRQQPPEAAEPVHWGGELLGAIGCRWIAGSSPVPRLVAEALRGAALCLGTHLRALIETPAPPAAAAWNDLLGDTQPAVDLREAVHRAALAPFPVLIEGESGSGKELVARAIHRLSPRHGRRFCAINCAALGDELVEAELFGHTRGAFTGAVTERPGLFEEADGGTLFLDEIGELSPRAQAKLLRVLQEGEVRRVGENLPRRVDVRIVAATNRSLAREAAEGRFRVDLRFRLDVLRIDVPTLRERAADVPLLAQHFWRAAAARVGSHATLGPDVLAALSRYNWPGNVRELQNAIAWLAVHAPRRGRVAASLIPAQLASAPIATGSFEAAREEFERRYVRAALIRAGGQRHVAARELGMSRQGLSKMLRRLRIDTVPLPDERRRG